MVAGFWTGGLQNLYSPVQVRVAPPLKTPQSLDVQGLAGFLVAFLLILMWNISLIFLEFPLKISI